MASSNSHIIDFTVSHRGKPYSLSLSPDTTVDELQVHLEGLTSVPKEKQKLLYKGKKAVLREDETLLEAGFKAGLKVQMLGSTADELGELKQVEDEYQKRERIMKERAQKSQAKVRKQTKLHIIMF
jgi:hypothetical protein